MSNVSSIILKVGAETAGAVSELRKVDKALGETATTGQKFQSAVGKAAIPAAAALTALTAVAVSSAKAAAEDAQSRQLLDSQIRRSTDSTNAAVVANESWIDAMTRQTALADDELRPAMAQLVRATGDVTESQKLLALSADLAAATGKPLATVTAAVAKGYEGSTTSLKKLVPSLSDAAVKSGDWAKVQKELNDQVGGAAADSANTAAGQYKLLQIQMGELQESIGAGLLPVMQALVPALTAVFEVAQGHSDVFLIVGGVVAAFAAAILATNAALSVYNTVQAVSTILTERDVLAKVASAAATAAQTVAFVAYRAAMIAARVVTIAFTAVQTALNVVLTANPIGVVVLALAALAAGLYLAYRHSATFRAVVQGAFSAAREAVQSLAGPLGQIVSAFANLYQRSAGVRSAVVGAFQAILQAIQDVVDAISDLVGWIGRIHFPSKPSWLPLSVPGVATAGVSPLSVSAAPIFHISVTGAIDPESTAIAIRRTLERFDRRRGRPLGSGGLGAAG